MGPMSRTQQLELLTSYTTNLHFYAFQVYALAPPLAHLFLAATLCGEAGMLSLNAGEESEVQRGCVT